MIDNGLCILGIDPGSCITGYGIIHQTTSKLYCLESGSIRLGSESFPNRLCRIYQSIHGLVAKFSPNVVAMEQIFMAKNAASALKLGHARGVAMVAASVLGAQVFEYAARQVKQTITGSGSADKRQVQQMVVALLKLTTMPAEDAADALAVAMTHATLAASVLRFSSVPLSFARKRSRLR